MTPSSTAESLRTATIGLLAALIALVLAWNLWGEIAVARAAVALLLTVPLWAPLPGVIQRNRRTYAWATLCVIPYFVMGLTEAIANPQRRAWAGACLALALLLFVTLIGYLRMTRAPSE
ncbi:putative membrane protein [Povalibacter uvarum]|uniref:Putative membrane protein n=1 Tax=Povalibacter uvarum TaxID=732238 RepID=A0A841HFG4_9GAMM|nr:DUF2069 domain-containing protein [Povalibacter uvarum]MBB6091423.1 putative membrane protein [Povalibacter uvarum]